MGKTVLAIIAVVAIGGMVVWHHHETTSELRAEIATLRADVQALRARPAEAKPSAALPNPELDAARAEIAQLQDQVAGLTKATQTLTRMAQSAPATPAAAAPASKYDGVPTRLKPIAALTNAGRQNPNAALETLLWAAAGGEVEAVADGIEFSPTGRERADQMFAQLSDDTRAKYGTPEKLLALMIAQNAATLTGMQVLGQREMDQPDQVGMRIRFGNDQGQTKEDSFLLHRGTDGTWRLMVSENTVDKFSKQMLGGH